MYIPAKPTTLPILQKLAADKGLELRDGVPPTPAGSAMRAAGRCASACGIMYGGSMPSGWTRWLLEQFEFPFEVVFPKTLDAGNLNEQVRRADLRRRRAFRSRRARRRAAAGAAATRETIPAEFRDWLGRVTVAKTVPELKKFVEDGGTMLTIGSSTALGHHLGLPIRDALVERTSTARSGRCRARSSTCPDRSSRRASTTRIRSPTAFGARRCLLRRQPGVPAAAGGRARRREAGRLDRRRRRRCAAAGRGASSTSIRRSRSSKRPSARAASCCSVRRSRGARSRTARSSCSSTASTTVRRTDHDRTQRPQRPQRNRNEHRSVSLVSSV